MVQMVTHKDDFNAIELILFSPTTINNGLGQATQTIREDNVES